MLIFRPSDRVFLLHTSDPKSDFRETSLLELETGAFVRDRATVIRDAFEVRGSAVALSIERRASQMRAARGGDRE
jgi:hypothetical protein